MEVALELRVIGMSNKFRIFRRMPRIFHPWALSGEVKVYNSQKKLAGFLIPTLIA